MASLRKLAVVSLFAVLASLPLAAQSQSACLGHHPQYIDGKLEIWYTAGCTGHDEPELTPLSSAPGSARDLTWTVVLPTDGGSLVSDVGPTFWFGGTVTDPHSLFGQAFVELQFYPDSIVSTCFNNGGFSVNYSANTYTVCSPVWKVVPNNTKAGGFAETAAFNAMLQDSLTPGSPLIMHAGDTITVHYYVTAAQDGFHITVTDLNTNRNGTIVLNSSSDGPLMPAYDTQTLGNDLQWGSVADAPNSFVWEIGHTSVYNGGAALCNPGQTNCDSYNASSWAGFSPIQIKSVTFGDGSTPKNFAVVSDQGGEAFVNKTCSVYGGAFCIYPWYTLGTTGYHYGVDYPDNRKDFGQALQFQETKQCSGPFGANTMYCSTVLK